MSNTQNNKVQPEQWKKLISNSKYSNEFCPRMIFKNNENKWMWQANKNTTIDISNWLLHWKVHGKEKLLTMDQMETLNLD